MLFLGLRLVVGGCWGSDGGDGGVEWRGGVADCGGANYEHGRGFGVVYGGGGEDEGVEG